MEWFCLAILIVPTVLANQNPNLEETPVGRFEQLMNRIDYLEQKLEASDEKREKLEEIVATQNRKINMIERELDVRNDKIVKLDGKVRAHEALIDKLKTELKDQDKKHCEDIKRLTKDTQRFMEVIRAVGEDKHKTAKTESDTGSEIHSNPSSGLRHARFNELVSELHGDQRARRLENEMEVAFFTTLTKTVSHIGTQQTIVFDKVVTNVGNAYNPNAGVFVAPVAGTYVFSTTLATERSHASHYGIYKNNAHFATMLLNGHDNAYDSSTQTIILVLATGDTISVRHMDNNHALHGINYCHFSGFLLTQHYTGSSSSVLVG